MLELGEKLGLTADQRARVQAMHAAMNAETVPLGERLITQENELDRLFASRAVTPATLHAVTAAIWAAQAELRAAHLHYDLSTKEILTPDQARRYGELRGYMNSLNGVPRGTGIGEGVKSRRVRSRGASPALVEQACRLRAL